jgi:hypothetical protein
MTTKVVYRYALRVEFEDDHEKRAQALGEYIALRHQVLGDDRPITDAGVPDVEDLAIMIADVIQHNHPTCRVEIETLADGSDTPHRTPLTLVPRVS